ncbi:hypothetical protein H5410_050353 [Solanum commersonii]|uniref:Uncharacterized protein n=1 Tax=Solanum commersonii TaxID=4109 RepID=A0A9J5WXP7_SOLCO|nr:hypothetical protein H5410_050353 [Solanum commersonii]
MEKALPSCVQRNRGSNELAIKSEQGSRLERVGEGRRLLFRGFYRIAAGTLTFLTAEEEGERGRGHWYY